uniref:Uncharacterized protein n=1 Tax=Romanomermis culicivorax TaxID=13658 RepID=A0A915HW27_ROMCU
TIDPSYIIVPYCTARAPFVPTVSTDWLEPSILRILSSHIVPPVPRLSPPYRPIG